MLTYLKPIFFIFLSSVIVQTTQISFCSEPSIESVLQRYEDGLRTIRSVRVHLSNETGNLAEKSIFAFQDGSSLFRNTVSYLNRDMQTTELLYQDFVHTWITENLDENNQKNHVVSFEEMASNSQEKDSVILSLYCVFGELPFDLFGKRSIVDVLRSYVSSMDEVNVDGKNMLEMKGSKNGVAVTARFVLNDYATLYGLKIDVDEKIAESGSWVAFEYLPADFVQYGHLLIPHTYQFTYSLLTLHYEYDRDMNLVPGRTTRNSARFQARIENVEINPRIPQSFFRISLDIPNGTPALNRRASHIDYIWWDGEIIPKTCEAMLAIARGGRTFMPGPTEPRFWLVTIGILLMLVGGGKMLYDHIKKTKGGA